MQTLSLINDNTFYLFSIAICIYFILYNFGGPRHTRVWQKAFGTYTKGNKHTISESLATGRVTFFCYYLMNIILTTNNIFPQLECFLLLPYSFKYTTKH